MTIILVILDFQGGMFFTMTYIPSGNIAMENRHS